MAKLAMHQLRRLFFIVYRSRVLRAAFSGGVGVVVQTAIFEVLGIWWGVVRPSTAVLIGAEFGILTNFVISNLFVFADAPKGPIVWRLAKFHLVIMGSLFIQWLFVYSTELATHDWYALHAAYAAGILVGFVSNYTGYRLWVWRHPTPPSE